MSRIFYGGKLTWKMHVDYLLGNFSHRINFPRSVSVTYIPWHRSGSDSKDLLGSVSVNSQSLLQLKQIDLYGLTGFIMIIWTPFYRFTAEVCLVRWFLIWARPNVNSKFIKHLANIEAKFSIYRLFCTYYFLQEMYQTAWLYLKTKIFACWGETRQSLIRNCSCDRG